MFEKEKVLTGEVIEKNSLVYSVKQNETQEEDLFQMVMNSFFKIFKVKNKQYGNAFMRANRIFMFNEIKRKYERFVSLFEEDRNSLVMNGDPKIIIPTMFDLGIYCIMVILNELSIIRKEDRIQCLNNICIKAEKFDDKIDVEENI